LKEEKDDTTRAIDFKNSSGNQEEDIEKEPVNAERYTRQAPLDRKEKREMTLIDELKATLAKRNEKASVDKREDETTEPDGEEEGKNFTDVPDYNEIKEEWNTFLEDKKKETKDLHQQKRITMLNNEIKTTTDTDGLRNVLTKYTNSKLITNKFNLANDFNPPRPGENKAFLLGGRKTLRNMKYKLKRTQNKRSNKRKTKKHHK
jgi:hypothetical protein